jgi:phosphatidylserine decarboxylase
LTRLSSDFDDNRGGPGAALARLGAIAGIAPEGVALALAIVIAGAILIVAGLRAPGAIVVLAGFAVGVFFRDPDRFPARTEGVILSGADGKVTDIAEAPLPGGEPPQFHRISVFMSPLNVHVNRAPVGGSVTRVEHTTGEFRAAFRDDASEHNERNLIVFCDPQGRRFGMMQVAGYLARRIVCRVRARDIVHPAQRVGLIMFGSRVDHFFPPEYRVTVAPGDRVRAGETVIGELHQ